MDKDNDIYIDKIREMSHGTVRGGRWTYNFSIDKHTDRQAGRQTGRQAGTQTGRQKERAFGGGYGGKG